MINLTYTRIRNLMLATLKATPEWPALDPYESDMLYKIADVWAKNEDITVLQAVNLVDNSTATAHTRLNILRDKGVIIIVTSTLDRRKKFVKPTQLTIDFFNKFGNDFSNLNIQ